MSSHTHRSSAHAAQWLRASLLALFLLGCGRTGPSLPPPSPVPSQADLDRECVFLRSCPIDLVSLQQDDCDIRLRFAYAGAYPDLQAPYGIYSRPECALQATDCRSYWNCRNAPYGVAYCAAHPGATCDHNVAVDCVRGSVQDCSASGATCVPVGVSGMPGTVLCRNTIPCTPSTDALLTCEGNVLTQCDPSLGVGVTFDVCPSGETCHPYRSGSLPARAHCSNDAVTCTTWGSHCEGSVVVVCGGQADLPPAHHETRVDCARAGYQCTENDAGSALCQPVATECDATFVDGCVGTALHVCVNGLVRSIDCTAYGFATCALDFGNNPYCVAP